MTNSKNTDIDISCLTPSQYFSFMYISICNATAHILNSGGKAVVTYAAYKCTQQQNNHVLQVLPFIYTQLISYLHCLNKNLYLSLTVLKRLNIYCCLAVSVY